MELECFNEDDFALALKRNIRALTVGKIPSVKPEAILLGGQSGAGKTLLIESKKRNFKVILSLLMEIYFVFNIRIMRNYISNMVRMLYNILMPLPGKWWKNSSWL